MSDAKPKAILLPGGAGYIGSHVVVELLERTDYIVLVVDNLSNAVGHAEDPKLNPPSLSRAVQAVTAGDSGKEKVEDRLKFYYSEYDSIDTLEQVNREFEVVATIIVAGFKAVGESKQKPLRPPREPESPCIDIKRDPGLGPLATSLPQCTTATTSARPSTYSPTSTASISKTSSSAARPPSTDLSRTRTSSLCRKTWRPATVLALMPGQSTLSRRS